ncbi:hypothetical protein AGABI1DRAFT_68775 [Agaricus bisporus var. burnettii JB137-S8]|uniref:Major facilitator superfamily (MFS) profile domain-containing protein n=1 Tax=Agaricus bisporus var. burnettii (strain JB137-S8 / ATCC MYA-4627 / FGSC 10392) TaxID=597362 RepID=K5X4M8_AGABU|nr:uncharacterized protein AGABI1DRAFT_68775 [Agaricus bisporus var. burnettii JB137-S8]EKM82806.1 hypothetical protein AGABI1DRAFT_68775 [Agaricus bisporus var. burnettii JB137-S8]
MDISEETALLPAVDAQQDAPNDTTPLPKLQLAVLCATRLMDPLTFTQIYPYINQLLSSLNIVSDGSQIGFYSGLESSFAFFQLLVMYQWARTSDVIGRRPVIIIGTAGLAISTVFFGLTSSLSQILIARCLAGLFSGTTAVLHSALGEITDQSNQVLAFPVFGLFWPLGNVIGPIIGGALVDPVEHFPQLFGSSAFLRQYPHFLPCLFSGLMALSAALFAHLYLCEVNYIQTFHTVANIIEKDSPTAYVPYLCTDSEDLTTRQLFAIPIIGVLCLSGFVLCFVGTAFEAIFVLLCYTSVESGGLSFGVSAPQIGYALAIAGISSIIIQLAIFPSLLRRFSHARLYSCFMLLWPLTFAMFPLLHFTISTLGGRSSHALALVWTEIALLMALSRFAWLSYSVSLVLCKEHAPGPRSLAKTNALVLFSMSIARAGAPAFVSSIFAWSTEHHIAGGYLWVIIMVLICLLGCFLSKDTVRICKAS